MRGNTEITAIGATHIGTEDYYKELQKELDSIPEGLFEGVKPLTDPSKIMPEKQKYLKTLENLSFSYEKMAKYMNMKVQKDSLKYGVSWQDPDMTIEEVINATPASLLERFSNMRVSSDLLDNAYKNHPTEVSRLLKGQSMMIYKHQFISDLLQRFIMGKESSDAMENVLLGQRNQKLFDVLESKLNQNVDKVGVIYGAKHLEELHDYLMDKGFEKQEERWLPAWELTEEESKISLWKAISTVAYCGHCKNPTNRIFTPEL